MGRIRVQIGKLTVSATLNDSATASRVYDTLPFRSSAQRWGDEVYFTIPMDAEEEDPQAEVPSGTVAYWPPGKALCLFFGQKPYSAVNVVGQLEGDPMALANVKDGEDVHVEHA
jgi:hypothetical protein